MGIDCLILLLMVLLLSAAVWRKKPVYDLFVIGAEKGFKTAWQILPNLAAMMVAIQLMFDSGLMDALCGFFTPFLSKMGLPSEVAPLILIRPVSGSGALGVLKGILDQCGADSRAGLIASTVMGSSETVFYTICVYMSAVDIKKAGYAIPCSLIGALAGIWLAAKLF